MSLDLNDSIDLTDEQTALVFLTELDSMIESTEEFIADDSLTPNDDPEGRFRDLAALRHVRQLWEDRHEATDD